jgi:hypothetical protein
MLRLISIGLGILLSKKEAKFFQILYFLTKASLSINEILL